jgi:antitoxin VapB
MNAHRKISAFKSGNSVALRVPKSSGIKPGDQFDLVERGGIFELVPVLDLAHEKAELAALVSELRAIGPIGGDPNDGRIEFPERPGLV